MTKFWEETGTALSKRLFASGGAGLVFWTWAVAMWAIHQGGWRYVQDTVRALTSDTGLATLLATSIIAIIVLSASSLVVERLTLPVLRLLEGYWPRLVNRLWTKRIARWHRKVQELQTLPPAPEATTDAIAAASAALRRFPPDDQLMPTRIGNIIRAGERRPATWYGLDAVIVWPQLWLVLPEQPRSDLTTARTQLNNAVTAWTWAVLSCVLGFLWLPALVVGLVVAFAIWRWWVPAAADTYATLVSAVFDTHRFALYDALHYPRPTTSADEPRLGRALTHSLWDDPSQAPTTYAAPPAAHQP